ncbi:MAG: thioredoxin domain-containing protein [Bdellovibrionales bacterium]|nr:thioredoxin domain-containing protein [Bdellovibrionales bacterium]
MPNPVNRLAQETSPYLRQHAENPVDWYPWGPEALERAKKENKPILLSIGYSACHWCHVMAHESFENAEIAALMNAEFVNVKVDREERPDLDQIYQNVAQAITRGGGWPLTVFLLPDGRPFFGGTYFPPEDRWGRPGFPRLLRSLADACRNDTASVEENAAKLTNYIAELEKNGHAELPPIAELSAPGPATAKLRELLVDAESRMLSGVDWDAGGFGGAPKFPNTMMLSFLLRMGSPRAIDAVVLTLTKMAKGGIFDQLGGGFHRYAVDDYWAVPHFEKMLYDNGLLLQLYAEVLLRNRFERIARRPEFLAPETRALFVSTLRKTAEYILREMESPDGGYYAAQDADSEGEEGKYFVFDPKDLASMVDPVEARVLALRYGIDEKGNFEHGKTVLFQARTEAEVAAALETPVLDVRAALAIAERKLLAARESRVKPGLDDKLLVGWNGLAISGMAWAAHALENEGEDSGHSELTVFAEKVRESAIRAFARIGNLPIPADSPYASTLPATVQYGQAKGNGFLDDYAFMARAALDLNRFGAPEIAGQKPEEWAALWTNRIIDSFRDVGGDPGFFFTSHDHEKLLQRPKSLYDQAIPSGTAVACSNLVALAEVLEVGPRHPAAKVAEYGKIGEEMLKKLAPHLVRNPYGHGELASALRLLAEGVRVFTGERADDAVVSDRDYVPAIAGSPRWKGAEGTFKVCARGVCRGFASLEKWIAGERPEKT